MAKKPLEVKTKPLDRSELLTRMKAELSEDPEARQSFRDDVQRILEVWDGISPLLWFQWEMGTHLMLLGAPNAPRNKVFADQREFEVAVDMARGGSVFLVEPLEGKYQLGLLSMRDARIALRAYYDEKEPLASMHAL